jgi:hypothetical protein
MATAATGHAARTTPATLPELLRLLDVADKTVGGQWETLLTWLTENKTTPSLWRSLLRNGYGLQIEQALPNFERPIPYRRIITEFGTKESMLL